MKRSWGLGVFILFMGIAIFPAHGALTNAFERNKSTLKDKVVNMAIIKRENGEFCILDVRERPDLLPSFLHPAGENSVFFSDNSAYPVCEWEEELTLEVSARHFAYHPEGVQVAIAPWLPVAGLIAIQCVASVIVETDDDGDVTPFVSGTAGFLALAGSSIAFFGKAHNVVSFIKAFGIGAASVAAYWGCGKVTYLLIEEDEQLSLQD